MEARVRERECERESCRNLDIYLLVTAGGGEIGWRWCDRG